MHSVSTVAAAKAGVAGMGALQGTRRQRRSGMQQGRAAPARRAQQRRVSRPATATTKASVPARAGRARGRAGARERCEASPWGILWPDKRGIPHKYVVIADGRCAAQQGVGVTERVSQTGVSPAHSGHRPRLPQRLPRCRCAHPPPSGCVSASPAAFWRILLDNSQIGHEAKLGAGSHAGRFFDATPCKERILRR